MLIQIDTDKNINLSADVTGQIEAEVEDTFARYAERITRVGVHLGDENADKARGVDKRCTLEVRLAGRGPVAVTHDGLSVEEACSGALRKAATLLDNDHDRKQHRKGGESIRHMPALVEPLAQ